MLWAIVCMCVCAHCTATYGHAALCMNCMISVQSEPAYRVSHFAKCRRKMGPCVTAWKTWAAREPAVSLTALTFSSLQWDSGAPYVPMCDSYDINCRIWDSLLEGTVRASQSSSRAGTESSFAPLTGVHDAPSIVVSGARFRCTAVILLPLVIAGVNTCRTCRAALSARRGLSNGVY